MIQPNDQQQFRTPHLCNSSSGRAGDLLEDPDGLGGCSSCVIAIRPGYFLRRGCLGTIDFSIFFPCLHLLFVFVLRFLDCTDMIAQHAPLWATLFYDEDNQSPDWSWAELFDPEIDLNLWLLAILGSWFEFRRGYYSRCGWISRFFTHSEWLVEPVLRKYHMHSETLVRICWGGVWSAWHVHNHL